MGDIPSGGSVAIDMDGPIGKSADVKISYTISGSSYTFNYKVRQEYESEISGEM